MFCVTVDSNLVYANVCKHTDLNKWYCSLEDASRLYSLTMRESTMCAVLFKPFVCGPIAKGDRSKTLNSQVKVTNFFYLRVRGRVSHVCEFIDN